MPELSLALSTFYRSTRVAFEGSVVDYQRQRLLRPMLIRDRGTGGKEPSSQSHPPSQVGARERGSVGEECCAARTRHRDSKIRTCLPQAYRVRRLVGGRDLLNRNRSGNEARTCLSAAVSTGRRMQGGGALQSLSRRVTASRPSLPGNKPPIMHALRNEERIPEGLMLHPRYEPPRRLVEIRPVADWLLTNPTPTRPTC
jgi:hypothetical protein